MSILGFFKKLIGGKVDEPLADYYTRSIVRTGNLDWQGLPLDRHAGAPITHSPGQKRHLERVNELLKRVGRRIEQRSPPHGVQAVAGLGTISDIFQADANRQASARWRQPPSDSWLHSGDAPGWRPQRHRSSGDDWLRQGGSEQ
jgi:hypothetical protein